MMCSYFSPLFLRGAVSFLSSWSSQDPGAWGLPLKSKRGEHVGTDMAYACLQVWVWHQHTRRVSAKAKIQISNRFRPDLNMCLHFRSAMGSIVMRALLVYCLSSARDAAEKKTAEHPRWFNWGTSSLNRVFQVMQSYCCYNFHPHRDC